MLFCTVICIKWSLSRAIGPFTTGKGKLEHITGIGSWKILRQSCSGLRSDVLQCNAMLRADVIYFLSVDIGAVWECRWLTFQQLSIIGSSAGQVSGSPYYKCMCVTLSFHKSAHGRKIRRGNRWKIAASAMNEHFVIITGIEMSDKCASCPERKRNQVAVQANQEAPDVTMATVCLSGRLDSRAITGRLCSTWLRERDWENEISPIYSAICCLASIVIKRVIMQCEENNRKTNTGETNRGKE